MDILRIGESHTDRGVPRSAAMATVEVIASVGLATAAIAALQGVAPAAGLSIVYLLAVLTVAIRRGELPALATSLLSVLTLNYLFITPRHRLTIAHSQDVVALAVLAIAAVVVGRLASLGRQRAAEAERRANQATAREREATLLAEVASAILEGSGVAAQLESVARRLARATGAPRARLALEPVPAPGPDELAVPVRSRARSAWLYVSRDTDWELADLERLSEPLGRLLDVAVERERVADQAAETEAARRADVARA